MWNTTCFYINYNFFSKELIIWFVDFKTNYYLLDYRLKLYIISYHLALNLKIMSIIA